MYNLYYLHFNNYYNRLLKRYETLAEYQGDSDECGVSLNVNFFPNDGVSTTHTPYIKDFNLDSNNSVIIPDYLIVCDTNNNILSRWYVIECVYNTGKTQYKMSLYRDVIAEFWNDVVNKPFYCEKGYLSISDNGIFNDEAIVTSQIKMQEQALNDKTGTPWIVGYRSIPEDNENLKPYALRLTTPNPDYTVTNLSDFEYYNTNLKFAVFWELYYQYYYRTVNNNYIVSFNQYNTYNPQEPSTKITNWGNITLSPWSFAEHIKSILSKSSYDSLTELFENYTDTSTDVSDLISFKNRENKIIYVESEQKYYKIEIYEVNQESSFKINTNSDLGAMMLDIIKDITNTYGLNFIGTIDTSNIGLHWNGKKYSYNYVNVTTSQAFFFNTNTINILADAPYCAFCIPYGEIKFINGDTEVTTNANLSLNIASELSRVLGSKIYDIQLLPYCPIQSIRDGINKNSFNMSNMAFGIDYSLISNSMDFSSGIDISYIFWLKTSNFKFDIINPLVNYRSSNIIANTDINYKVENQTVFFRICAPNYNGVFEINPYKNRGIDVFTVNCTLKPYQPFIHLAPNFKGLYGSDYNDSRGLILGGDFSLPIISDKWVEYQIQNKNYQTMFNRQIENMEISHKYQRREQIANAITGTISAAATGGISGAMVGGGIGGLIGGGIGGVASAVGGIMDLTAGDALRTEALDYARDMYGYNLDNIKALPNALTRVSAFSIINKLFPFIEVYTCTNEEREAVKNKIIYNGMTVERIGTINQFLGYTPRQYIKGKLIRFENLTDDFHILKTLSDELNKGVFVNNGYTI